MSISSDFIVQKFRKPVVTSGIDRIEIIGLTDVEKSRYVSAQRITCTFASKRDPSRVFITAGNYSAASGTIFCPTYNSTVGQSSWGVYFEAEQVQLSLYDLPLQTTGLIDNSDFYFEESLTTLSRTNIDAAGTEIAVSGFGFSPNRTYLCLLTALPPAYSSPRAMWSDILLVGLTPPSIQSYTSPFRYVSPTAGVCGSVAWPDSVGRRAFFSLLHPSPALLEAVVDAQRIVAPAPIFSFSREAINAAFIDVTLEESFSRLSTLFDTRAGGAVVTVAGAGFTRTSADRPGPAAAVAYHCLFLTPAEAAGPAPLNATDDARRAVAAAFAGPTALLCVAPLWASRAAPPAVTGCPGQAEVYQSTAVFRLRKTLLAATGAPAAARSVAVSGSAAEHFLFQFHDAPVWSEDTVAEDSVFVSRVRCDAFEPAGPGPAPPGALAFAARAGPGAFPLRLSLLYTPLRLLPGGAAFGPLPAGAPPPALRAVVSGTEELGTAVLAWGGDAWAANGSLGLGPARFLLDFPAEGQPPRAAAAGGGALAIPSNLAVPAGLRLAGETDCGGGGGGGVAGNLSWDVQAGWEGQAYRLCVVARPAGVPAAVAVAAAGGVLAARCFFVVVPKCQRCYRQGDTLHSIGSLYGGGWRDVWGVNPGLVRTTAAGPDDEAGFNTPLDLVYVQVDDKELINTSNTYRLGPGDTLDGLGPRFGTTLGHVLALNPDVDAVALPLLRPGTPVCILPRPAAYSQCAPAAAPAAEPGWFERVTGYDSRGVPIKVPNPRYPREPRPPSVGPNALAGG